MSVVVVPVASPRIMCSTTSRVSTGCRAAYVGTVTMPVGQHMVVCRSRTNLISEQPRPLHPCARSNRYRLRTARREACEGTPLSEVPAARVASVLNVALQDVRVTRSAEKPGQIRSHSHTPPSVTTRPVCQPSPWVAPRILPLSSLPLQTLGHMPVSFEGCNNPRPGARKCRVLCYGDSLTAGFCSKGRQYEPYGRSLAEALSEVLGSCEVSVCGHSGHTAAEMVANLDRLAVEDVGGLLGKGLRRSLDEAVHRPDLVIIMAGTNDLGQNAGPQRIIEDLAQLHGVCHSRGVPTVAVSPPPAPRAAENSSFEVRRKSLQDLLINWVHSSPGAAAFVNPSELVPAVLGGSAWDPDGLHLSPAGSRLLGQRLAEVLTPMLLSQCKASGDVGCSRIM